MSQPNSGILADSPSPTAANDSSSALNREEPELNRRFWFFHAMPSWMVSFFAHIALIIFLAIWFMPELPDQTVSLEAGDKLAEAVAIDVNLDEMDFVESDPFENEMTETVTEELPTKTEPLQLEDVDPIEFGDFSASDLMLEDAEIGPLTESDLSNETSGRTSDAARKEMLRKYGGSAATERAVAMALEWIADHQLQDGGWSFDHRLGPLPESGRRRTSPNPGMLADARNAATAMALLPFLGNGQTHIAGQYKETVRRGLQFLMNRGRARFRGLSYREPGGTMYSHGLVAIVFAEAYAMTQDETLREFAQGTLWYIEDAQDPFGGGWRYEEKQPGDTSVVGWQVMALKSGRMSGLQMDRGTLQLVARFLDFVSIEAGAFYGYDEPPRQLNARARSRTAIGLLCRMYMGWKRDAVPLVKGIKWLSELGPDTDAKADMYYNYYATQLMKQYGGGEWEKWNREMRDFLIKSQETDGPARGSWMFDPRSHSGSRGGRLYTTALCAMTLEVYYRYLPIYDDKAVDEFPLE